MFVKKCISSNKTQDQDGNNACMYSIRLIECSSECAYFSR